MLAKTQGVFRLTRDLELRYTTTGSPIAKLGLACSEKRNEKETQLFIDAVAFGRAAEVLNQYAGQKGTPIYITGKLQTESWVGQDGKNRSKISLVIEDFEFIKPKSQTNQAPQQGHYGAYANQQPQSHQTNQPPQVVYQNAQGNPTPPPQPQQDTQQSPQIPEIDISEDEIPF
jgi:single-strand DNA-binding protein